MWDLQSQASTTTIYLPNVVFPIQLISPVEYRVYFPNGLRSMYANLGEHRPIWHWDFCTFRVRPKRRKMKQSGHLRAVVAYVICSKSDRVLDNQLHYQTVRVQLQMGLFGRSLWRFCRKGIDHPHGHLVDAGLENSWPKRDGICLVCAFYFCLFVVKDCQNILSSPIAY